MSTIEAQMQAIRVRLPRVATIIEPGACDGQSTERLSQLFESGRYYLIEPDARNVIRLRRMTKILRKRHPGITYDVTQGAIGGHTGVTVFHPAAADFYGSGSIHAPTDKLRRNYPDVAFEAPCEVPCWTLDDFCAMKGITGDVDLIWADVQGAEKDLVRHGQRTLARTRLLNLEVSECGGVYRDSWRISEMYAELATWEKVDQYGPDVLFENII